MPYQKQHYCSKCKADASSKCCDETLVDLHCNQDIVTKATKGSESPISSKDFKKEPLFIGSIIMLTISIILILISLLLFYKSYNDNKFLSYLKTSNKEANNMIKFSSNITDNNSTNMLDESTQGQIIQQREEEEEAFSSSQNPLLIVPPSPASSNFPENTYKVIMNYQPILEDEISLFIGDSITIKQKFDDGWALGKNWNLNVIGAFPLVCLNLNEDTKSENNGFVTNINGESGWKPFKQNHIQRRVSSKRTSRYL